jgi:signal transduction histidine kinase
VESILLKNDFREYILSREQQRKYIAEVLQNSVNQGIVSANLKMIALVQDKSITNKIRKDASDLNILLSNLSKEVTVMADLSFPLVLQNLGLEKAIEDLCAKFSKELKTSINFHVDKSLLKLTMEININVYRLIENILISLNKTPCFLKITLVFKTYKNILKIEFSLMNNDQRVLNENINNIKQSNIIFIIKLLNGNYSFDKQINSGIRMLIRIPIK